MTYRSSVKVSLFTGGDDPNYAIPLAASLAEHGVEVEFIGNDAMAGSGCLQRPNIQYFNLRGNQDPTAPMASKIFRVLRYYRNLIAYACRADTRLFHILWLNKFDVLDRVFLTALYKARGKKLVFTAHNVNARKRDGKDTWINRMTLRAMYSILDHIFVHTDAAREELVREYRVTSKKISVIPFGLNTYVPDSTVSQAEARMHLGVGENDRVLLFFGQIAPYKGIDVLLDSMRLLAAERYTFRLIIAGRAKPGSEPYWDSLRGSLQNALLSSCVIRDGFVPDADVPILFRAADALVLPYRAIYQSGPFSLAQRFGVPVIATKVGSFERDVASGENGVLCDSQSPESLASAIRRFFESELYSGGELVRKRIRENAFEKYSWAPITRRIVEVYARLDQGVSPC